MGETAGNRYRPAQPPQGEEPGQAEGRASDILNEWLVAGGDSRLRVNPATQLSDYGCQAFPRPALSFASSTASSISERGYAAAAEAFAHLQKLSQFAAFDAFVETMRADLKALWGLAEDTDVIFAPSGTDAELRALFVAQSMLRAPTISLVVAAEESGSGVPYAAAGRHFNSGTANGARVIKGRFVRGLGSGVGAVEVPALNASGGSRPLEEIDADVVGRVRAVISGGSSVALHVMLHSKLGTCAPSVDCIGAIRGEFGPAVQIIVDACQARLSRAQLNSYLGQADLVLLTGSKFFTGPAFSGAVLVPAALSARASEQTHIPFGLVDYSNASDWPARYRHVRALMPQTMNLGQALRWAAALEEMRRYFAVPDHFRAQALTAFAAFAGRRITDDPQLHLLPQPASMTGEEFAARTVFPFLLTRNGRTLSLAETKLLYQGLNDDLSQVLGGSAEQRGLLARACHIGQPVAIPRASGETAGALRVAADARMISECWFAGPETDAVARFQAGLEGLQVVFDKLTLMLAHVETIKHAVAA
jgi:hypothetical protein